MVKSELLPLWTKKETSLGKRLTIGEVADKTGLSRDTVSGLLRGTTTRFDSGVMAKLCEYFDVSDGEPVPFLTFRSG